MKEKTFSELIEEGLSTIDDFDDVPVLMLKLLQQVREATIAECWDIVSRLVSFEDGYNFSQDFNDIKKDSIQIEEYTFEEGDDKDLPF